MAIEGFAPSGLFTKNPFSMSVDSCSGPVVLENMTLDSQGAGPGLRARNSRLVGIANSTSTGVPAVEVSSRVVVATGAMLSGTPGNGWVAPGLHAGAGILLTGGSAILSRCQVRGGNGGIGTYAAQHDAGIRASGAEIRLAGPGSSVTGGSTSFFGHVTYAPAISASGGSLTRDPAVGISGALQLSGTVERVTYVPAVTAVGSGPGARTSVDVFGAGAATAVVFVSLPQPRSRLSFGDLWIDPGLNVLLWSGTLFGGARNLSVPVDPVYPRGTTWAFQGATLDPVNGLRLTDPAIVVLH